MMRSDGRYLSVGLAIGASIAALTMLLILFIGPLGATLRPSAQVGPALTAWPPNMPDLALMTPTAVATYTAISPLTSNANIPAGFDPASTPTADPIISTIDSGGLIFTGALSNAEQINLYRASLTYVQTTVRDSKREAKEINGVGYGDPTNICGPLAIAILRDARVISPDIVPHDFWLLDPRNAIDQRILARAFPAEAFVHTKISTALNKVDWLSSPLEPGDFLFIWHGSGGNFDHMLVVNRVDAEHRAYAVTNYGTPDGYIIAETLLYDPHDPNAGIFHTWTKEQDAILGSTGFGGYEIWRSRPH